MSLVHNERVKLSATYLNNIGVGCFIAGFVAPSISLANNGFQSSLVSVLGGAAWFLVGLTLHFLARRLLGGLKP
jgi:hypothetical protein